MIDWSWNLASVAADRIGIPLDGCHLKGISSSSSRSDLQIPRRVYGGGPGLFETQTLRGCPGGRSLERLLRSSAVTSVLVSHLAGSWMVSNLTESRRAAAARQGDLSQVRDGWRSVRGGLPRLKEIWFGSEAVISLPEDETVRSCFKATPLQITDCKGFSGQVLHPLATRPHV
jgi:hypothetical protein